MNIFKHKESANSILPGKTFQTFCSSSNHFGIFAISDTRDSFKTLWKSAKNEWTDLKLGVPKESRKN